MNKYLEKIASKIPEKDKDDFVNTAILGGLGGVEGLALPHLWKHPKLANMGNLGKGTIAAGVTLGVDYAGVRMGNAINRVRHGESAIKE